MIFSSFNNKAQMKMLGALQQLKQGTVQSLPTAVQDRLPDSLKNSVNSANEVRHVEELIESTERVSSSHNEYIAPSGESYVLIEGKYYKARKDNIYEVNGRRVYYVNNRRYSKKEAQDNLAYESSVAESAPAPKAKSASAMPFETLDSADVPTSTTEALGKMQEAQQQIKERDKYVESLEY